MESTTGETQQQNDTPNNVDSPQQVQGSDDDDEFKDCMDQPDENGDDQ